MKKKIIWLLLKIFIVCLLLAAILYVTYTTLANGDPGYVLIGSGNWSIESSLFLFVMATAVTLLLLYALLKILFGLKKLPQHRKQKKIKRSQQALTDALVDSAEGNWLKAEKSLIRNAANSDTPLIHYLTAVRTAQSRGDLKRCNLYLKQAYKTAPDSKMAIGLTRANLQLSNQQFKEAVENLTKLKTLSPGHGSVLKLLHRAYTQVEDWEALKALMPELQKHKVLKQAEIKLLETEAYSGLLKKQAEVGNIAALKAHWHSTPKHIQAMPGVHSIYFAAMIEAGSGQEIEEAIAYELDRDWNESLLVLFAHIKSDHPEAQLQQAEQWLEKHPQDPILLRVLGKLSIHSKPESAEKYLTDSLTIEPSVDACLLLGDLLAERGQHEMASQHYRKGVLLASTEVVRNIEAMPSPLDQIEEQLETEN